jgi:hypothetical protein
MGGQLSKSHDLVHQVCRFRYMGSIISLVYKYRWEYGTYLLTMNAFDDVLDLLRL